LTNPDEPASETDKYKPNKDEPNCQNLHFDDIPARAPVPVEVAGMSDEDASQDSEEDQVLRTYFMSGVVD
jgi:hypothetical protein